MIVRQKRLQINEIPTGLQSLRSNVSRFARHRITSMRREVNHPNAPRQFRHTLFRGNDTSRPEHPSATSRNDRDRSNKMPGSRCLTGWAIS
jgi:hypothetical protein